MFKPSDSSSASLVDSLIREINYDYRYIASNMRNSLVTSPQVLERYVEGSIIRFNAIASYLFYNGHVSTEEYHHMQDSIKEYRTEVKSRFLASDIQSASTDPAFMANVEKAVEKYGTIN